MYQITNKERQSKQYRVFSNLIKDGYYIERSENFKAMSRTETPVILFTLQKDLPGKTRTIHCYLAYDLVPLFKKEFNAPVRNRKTQFCWLNDNPEKYRPEPGKKIIVEY